MNHIAAIQKALPEAGLDGVLLTCRANRFYAVDFDSYGTDGACLITPDHAWYWTDGRYIEAAGKRITGADVGLTDRAHPYKDLFAQVIRDHKIEKLGIDEEAMTLADHDRYAEALPCVLTGASAMMNRLRAVKDEEEVARMMRAQRIAEQAWVELHNDIRPGVTEKFLAARLIFLMLSYGAENVSFDPIVVSGPNGSMPHGVPSEKTLQDGEFVTFDFGALYQGYCSDMTRTVAIGHATDEMQHSYQAVLDAQLAAIGAFKAGTPGCDVHNAAVKVLEERGLAQYFTHGLGHSVGIEIHEAPNANPTNGKPLPEGAVVTAEPGIYIPGSYGIRIEDMVLVRKDGCANLTLAPKQLEIL